MPDTTAGLRRVLNAWGTATPYGVSRSDAAVAQAVAQMLQRHVVMAELQALAGRRIAQWSGAQAGCITHCTAAAITLAVAACMAGSEPRRMAQLPDSEGLKNRVLLLAAHAVNYGQALTQAIRLAGAWPVLCPSAQALQAALAGSDVACVLAVESHLAPGSGSAVTRELAAMARAAGVPLVLDGAAQDGRITDLLASGADLVLLSAQKYLRAPTAAIVLGRRALVDAVDAQHAGIGRAMKPSKEAMAGVIAALDLRGTMDRQAWLAEQQRKVDALAAAAAQWPGVRTSREADPQGNGFERVWLAIDPAVTGLDAALLVQRLRSGDPVVAVAPHRAAQGQVGLELTGLEEGEVQELCALLGRCFRLA
ncbi:beta-eliminating lyase-related protein [uncultured Ramlibacter sp.]|uniref:beta-eliminating lyase-related protein n=1 Tax=uncultured Ramlibacter sp. TaxID=260755 RepID=UPI002619A582|nr:beta-eliminating lyase-related protein [uncultured Ramlibacter sp.]